MKKIGLFGGAFDPIHNGHMKIASEALSLMGLDRVIFIPSGVSPHKNVLGAASEDRYRMVEIAIAGIKGFELSDYEITKETKGYSFETVTEFKKRYPEDELYFIIGDDGYRAFDKWYKAKELLALCTFLVFTRFGEDVLPPFVAMKTPPMAVESRNLRKMVEDGRDISAFVPKGVGDYILENGLYR